LTTFNVNIFNDSVDANPGDGVAEDADGNTSLRAAIMDANALPSDDVVVLANGTYVIEIPSASGADADDDLDIFAGSGSLTVRGNGPIATTIDGRSKFNTVFDVAGKLRLEDISVTGAKFEAISSTGGELTIVRSELSQNGSGIDVIDAVVVIEDSTLNNFRPGHPIIDVRNTSGAHSEVTLINSTISGGDIGIETEFPNVINLYNTTITENKRGFRNVNPQLGNPVVTAQNTVISGNDLLNRIDGEFNDLGGNFFFVGRSVAGAIAR